MTKSTRVVVADDDRHVAETLGHWLMQSHCDVRIAFGGQEALLAAEEFDPHCVMLDLRMPPPDGIDTAHRLRSKYGSDLVLIGFTGWGNDDLAQRPELSVMDYCLKKPIDLSVLGRIFAPLSSSDR